MQELVLAFCNVLQELIAQYVNKKFKEVEQFMRTFEQETMDQTKKISALEDSFKQEIAKQRLAVKKNKLRISGEDIVRIRKHLNLNQTAFAQLLRVDRSCVNRWEHGKIKPSQRTLQKIAPFREMTRSELRDRQRALEKEIWYS